MAKDKIQKTNVARLMDKAKIAYELIPYEVDENDLSAHHIVAQLGENIEQVFKTLVLHGDKTGHFVCVIPGGDEVDLKMAAKVSGNIITLVWNASYSDKFTLSFGKTTKEITVKSLF